jgi:hypothetical protein
MSLAALRRDHEIIPERSCFLQAGVWSWANVYKVSLSIFALNDLGVLKFISTEFHTAPQIATELNLKLDLLSALLDLLVSVGVLQRNMDGFRAHQGMETLLPLLSMESHLSATHLSAAQIAKVVRSGEPADIFQVGNVETYLPIFATAMRSSSRTLAPHLIRFCQIRQCRRVLDLGGADGSLAVALKRVAPHLTLTVVDLPRLKHAFETLIVVLREVIRASERRLAFTIDQRVDCLHLLM